MTYYVILQEKTIQIIPSWKTQLTTQLTFKERQEQTSESFAKLANRALLKNEFYIPLNKFNIRKVPQKVTIYYGDTTYNNLDDLINIIYNSRSYTVSEESAKKRIENLLIKGMSNKTKVYGKEIRYEFDFIDASDYEIIV